jgi:hypothetical protein
VSDFDLLRLPSPLDPTAPAYKDWFHLNLFDHASGSVGLVNVSLHGSPADPRARAIGTALIHQPGRGWSGNLEIAGFGEATIVPDGVLLAQVGVMVDPARRTLHASARLPEEGLSLRLTGTAAARPIRIELAQPFGSGWIAWFVVPRLRLEGRLELRGHAVDLASWSAYHDHNWGRWFWGEDIGWEWGVFAAHPPNPVFVLARLTNRLHRRLHPAQLIVVRDGRSRTFPPGSVALRLDGRADLPLRRLPGALAALHGDRVRPALPARLSVEAISGLDWVRLSFEARAVAQLIEGDPIRPGYSFIHELVGEFAATGRVRDEDIAAGGLAVFEYVT